MQLNLFSDLILQNEDQLLIDLFQAYFDARRNKRNTKNALKFEMHFEQKMFQLYEAILSQSYQPGRSIAFINFKPVQREIFAADFLDRVVHHLIFNYLNPIVEPGFIKDSYSCRKEKGTHYGIKRMQSFMRGCTENYTQPAWVLKLDILGYFMSIDQAKLYQRIKTKLEHYQGPIQIDKSLLLYLLEKVIFYDPVKNCIIKGNPKDWQGLPQSKSLFCTPTGKGFPIGNLTSQLFGNIYLNSLDHFIKEKLEIRYYGRYVDDFVLMHQDKSYLKSLISEINNYLRQELALELHPKKIYLQSLNKGFPFLGTFIKPYRTYIGKRCKKNFYLKIRYWNQFLETANFKLNATNLAKFIASMNSYLGTMKHFDTYRLRKKMIFQLRPEFFNYVYISGNYSKLVPKIRKMKKRNLC